MSGMKNLIVDEKTGAVSATRIWLHIANAMMTYVMYKQAASVDWGILTAYGSIVGGNYFAGQLMKWKFKNDGGSGFPKK